MQIYFFHLAPKAGGEHLPSLMTHEIKVILANIFPLSSNPNRYNLLIETIKFVAQSEHLNLDKKKRGVSFGDESIVGPKTSELKTDAANTLKDSSYFLDDIPLAHQSKFLKTNGELKKVSKHESSGKRLKNNDEILFWKLSLALGNLGSSQKELTLMRLNFEQPAPNSYRDELSKARVVSLKATMFMNTIRSQFPTKVPATSSDEGALEQKKRREPFIPLAFTLTLTKEQRLQAENFIKELQEMTVKFTKARELLKPREGV